MCWQGSGAVNIIPLLEHVPNAAGRFIFSILVLPYNHTSATSTLIHLFAFTTRASPEPFDVDVLSSCVIHTDI